MTAKPPMPAYLEAAIAHARALRVGRMSDADIARELGIPVPLVRRVRDELRQAELPLSVSIEERYRIRVERALWRGLRRAARRSRR